ncbi:MAG: UvrD-helicase domain-containing protein, partial [Acidobacteria bacterium]|nr:UvrD-helicase domain-containing protein [Acidobacteriota bacterium]
MDEHAPVSASFDAVTSPLRRGGADGVPHPLLIEASAGSGKTWTLAHLSARFMVEDDVEPHEILLLTFTRDAARQLRSRVRDRLDDIIGVLESGDSDAPWLDPF